MNERSSSAAEEPVAGASAQEAPQAEADQPAPPGSDASPAREMSLHLLRMLETRMDAAGLVLQRESELLVARLQLKLFAAAAVFIAVWGAIVLLAIALPSHLRVPVLSAVVIAFLVLAIAAHLLARRRASAHEVGSMGWLIGSLRQDFDVLSRALTRNHPQPVEPAARSTPHDLAA